MFIVRDGHVLYKSVLGSHLSLELLIFMHSISHAEKEPTRLTSVL